MSPSHESVTQPAPPGRSVGLRPDSVRRASFDQTAETVDRRTERQLDVLVRLIEPLILVMIAAVIGMVAVGLLYPIFTIADRLG